MFFQLKQSWFNFLRKLNWSSDPLGLAKTATADSNARTRLLSRDKTQDQYPRGGADYDALAARIFMESA